MALVLIKEPSICSRLRPQLVKTQRAPHSVGGGGESRARPNSYISSSTTPTPAVQGALWKTGCKDGVPED